MDEELIEEKLEEIVERKLAELGVDESSTDATRRGVLGAAGTAGLAGLLFGSSATGTASAQAAGSVGTPDSPVDVYGNDVVAERAEVGRLAGDVDADGNTVTNLPYPVSNDDAAPKGYVDDQTGGGGGGGDGSYPSGTAVVSQAENLQDALDTNAIVRIDGVLDLSDHETIQIPRGRFVYGTASFDYDQNSYPADVLYDDSAGPTIEMSGNNSKLFGFCIHNDHDDGIGCLVTAYSPNISHLDVQAGYVGVQFGDDAYDETYTEPRINWCRLYCRADNRRDDSTAILVENMHDAKITHNMIGGYNVGVRVETNHAYLTGNHTYAFPQSSVRTGYQIDARWVRLIGNRAEHGIEDAGILLGNWFGNVTVLGNLVEAQSGADGLRWRTDVGTLEHVLVANNNFSVTWGNGPADTAIDFGSNSLQRSYVGGNTIREYENDGDAIVRDSAGAGNAPNAGDHLPGVIVENPDDGSLWFNAGDQFVEIS